MNKPQSEEEALREAKRQYFREWRKRNPDKVREINLRYWKRKAEKVESGGSEN